MKVIDSIDLFRLAMENLRYVVEGWLNASKNDADEIDYGHPADKLPLYPAFELARDLSNLLPDLNDSDEASALWKEHRSNLFVQDIGPDRKAQDAIRYLLDWSREHTQIANKAKRLYFSDIK